eukprot:gb/GEZN01013524.1/.p1 GENE.gb/GEZN01013524.1/~~gb/GEZN01013524.1/.p1  ORF type:complete len:277 (-),score=29.09 gb/GEZN01013524.1/:145-975(-)
MFFLLFLRPVWSQTNLTLNQTNVTLPLNQTNLTLPDATPLHKFDLGRYPSADAITDIKIGNPIWVALVTVAGYDKTLPPSTLVPDRWNFVYQTAIKTVIDDYALLEVDNSYNEAQFPGNSSWLMSADTYFRVEIGSVVSQWRKRNDADTLVPFFTILPTVEDGTVVSLVWDDFCQQCESPCIMNNCAVKSSTCTTQGVADSTRVSDCDLKTYMGWTGTDTSGNYMMSAGKRISAFRQWAVSGMYNGAIQGVKDAPSKVPTGEEIMDTINGKYPTAN